MGSRGCCRFSHPAICCGAHLASSFVATTRHNSGCCTSLHRFGRSARSHAARSAETARYALRPPWRLTSRLTVEAGRPSSRVAARPRGRGAECAGTRRSRSAAGASQCPSVAPQAASAPIAPSALPAITRTALSVVPCALPVNATINTVSHSPFETTRWDLFSHTSRPSIRSLSSIDKVHQFNR